MGDAWDLSEYINDYAHGNTTAEDVATWKDEKTNPSVPTPGDGDALSQLRDLAQSNPEYMETYLQLLAERENTTNAQAWYEKMSGSQYQRSMDDLKKAGLNPWLALQSLSGAGSGSVSPAGTWSTSPYSNKIAKENAKINKDQNAIRLASIMTTTLIAALALIA